jgi:hypothetical protein
MGFKKTDKPRTARMELRLLPEEAADIGERARMSGLSTSEFIRRCALGRRIAMRYDAEAIEALTRLAETVGHLRVAVSQSGAAYDEEHFRSIAAECIETMQRMF